MRRTVKRRVYDLLLQSPQGVTYREAEEKAQASYVSVQKAITELGRKHNILKLNTYFLRGGKPIQIALFALEGVMSKSTQTFHSLLPTTQYFFSLIKELPVFTREEAHKVTGFDLTSCRFHLKALADAGIIHQKRGILHSKRRLVYGVADQGIQDDFMKVIGQLPDTFITPVAVAKGLNIPRKAASEMLQKHYKSGFLLRKRGKCTTGEHTYVYFRNTNTSLIKSIKSSYEFVIGSLLLEHKNGLTIAQIVKLSGLSVKIVRSTLQIMRKHGVLESDKYGSYYSANDDIARGKGHRLLITDVFNYAWYVARYTEESTYCPSQEKGIG